MLILSASDLTPVQTDHYRPQTKFAKVMFLQVSVCPQGGARVAGGACMVGGHVWQGGHAWWGQRWHGACMAGDVHGRGRAWQGGHVWQGGHARLGVHGRGACMAGGMHAVHPPQQILRDTVIWSMSGRYASYWNAFLVTLLTLWNGCGTHFQASMLILSVNATGIIQ